MTEAQPPSPGSSPTPEESVPAAPAPSESATRESARPMPELIGALLLLLLLRGTAGSHLYDVGELVAASVELGASHAPGQPLHALIGYLTHLVPLGPIVFRLTLLSAVCVVGAAYVLGATVGDVVHRGAPKLDPSVAKLAVNAAAIALVLAPPVLRQAIRPEVYGLALLLFTVGVRALLDWQTGDGRGVRVAALAAGCLLGVHPPHAFALVLVGALVLLMRDAPLAEHRSSLARSMALATLACVTGALVLAYLPLRGFGGAPMWGDPTTPSGFFSYVSGAAYRRNLGARDVPFALTALRVVLYLLRSGAAVPVIASLTVVLLRLRTTERRDPLALLGLAALASVAAACLTPLEERNPDNVAYGAPALALSLLLGAVALVRIASRRPRLASAALVLLAVVPPSVWDAPTVLAADSPPLETTAFCLVDSPPPRAFVLVRTDYVAASWVLDRAVDRVRPDVAFMAEGLATSSWHWRSLRHHTSFADGRPTRSSSRGADGREAWILGALERARPDVPVLVESHPALEMLGWLDGFYMRTPAPSGSASDRLWAVGSSGEVFAELPAAAIRWMPPGDHGQARDVIREMALRRVERLFTRRAPDRARDVLALALADAAIDLAPLAAISDGVRPLPPMVRDPGAVFQTSEDAVRVAARLLFAGGHPSAAGTLLQGQLDRGDDRALLQLAWLLLSDGMGREVEELLAAYRTAHGPSEVGALEEALFRLRTAPAP